MINEVNKLFGADWRLELTGHQLSSVGNHLPEQLLLKGDAAQGAANPPPLRRRNGPQLRHKRPPTSLKRRAPAYALEKGGYIALRADALVHKQWAEGPSAYPQR